MTELKPCPFCGSDASIAVSQGTGVCVRCVNFDCKCQTIWFFDNLTLLGEWPEKNAVDEVIKHWNRRDTPSDEDDDE